MFAFDYSISEKYDEPPSPPKSKTPLKKDVLDIGKQHPLKHPDTIQKIEHSIHHLIHHSIFNHLTDEEHNKHNDDLRKIINDAGGNETQAKKHHTDSLKQMFDDSPVINDFLDIYSRTKKQRKFVTDKLDKLPQEFTSIEDIKIHKYATMSKSAYAYFDSNADPESVKKVFNEHSYIKDLQNFEVDNSLSNLDDLVLFNKNTGEVHISYRGTKTLNDWKTNSLAFIGKERSSPLVKQAIKTAEDVVEKYGSKNLSVSGHSMGGMRGLEVVQNFSEKGLYLENHLYDAGVSARQMLKQHKLAKEFKVNLYRTHFDGPSTNVMFSNLNKPHNVKIHNIHTNIEVPINTPALDQHSLSHFTTSAEDIKLFENGTKVAVKRSSSAKVLSDGLKVGENILKTANETKIGKVVSTGIKYADKVAVPLQVGMVGMETAYDWLDPNKSQTDKVTDTFYNVGELGVESAVGYGMSALTYGAITLACPECVALAGGVALATSIGAMVGVDIGLDVGDVKKQTEQFVGDNIDIVEDSAVDFGDDVKKGANEIDKEAKILGENIEDGFNSSVDFASDSFNAVGDVFKSSWW